MVLIENGLDERRFLTEKYILLAGGEANDCEK